MSKSRGIGVKISPDIESSSVRMGLILRAQQVTVNIDGPFRILPPYNSINDGTNIHSWSFYDGINGAEEIKYTRLDAFFGASRSTGIFRPYGGFLLTDISGTDTIAVDDAATVYSRPVGGGVETSTTQQVAFNAEADITGGKNFSGVLGLSINLDNDLSMTAEVQGGAQNTISFSGSIGF